MEMGKVVTGLLSKDILDMAEMRAQVRNLEASPWYKESKATANLEGGAGIGLGAFFFISNRYGVDHQGGNVPSVRGTQTTQTSAGARASTAEVGPQV